jgi:uncharacterized protein YllA (UPF0747 family)
MPGQSRLFLDFCANALGAFLPTDDVRRDRPALPAHWPELVRLLATQNPQGSAAAALAALEQGAGAILTGQQVGLFGGPLFSAYKAATAIARARKATAAGHPHVAIFWLASEDHDFAEINQVTFPEGRELATLAYDSAPVTALPAGRIVFDESITALAKRAAEIFGPSEATDALIAAYKPGRTFAEAFAAFYARIFAAQGLLIVDASSREFHRLGAPVLRLGLERADEFHAALVERSQALEAAGYHSQVAPQSSLLFLIDEKTGARLALKRIAPTAQEPNGLWQAAGEEGNRSFTTGDLLGILDAEPERISPAALLRPVFQDFLFGTTAQVAGPAEIAYLAQSTVLFERILERFQSSHALDASAKGGVFLRKTPLGILVPGYSNSGTAVGRQTPPMARFSATLIEPPIAELLRKHELTLEQVFQEESAATLVLKLAARAMPTETKMKLAAAGNAFDAELTALVEWLQSQDKGLGQSAETAAGKMRYQMNRLRTMAANFQLQREATLTRHANSISNALYPGGVLQERVHGAAYYFARHGLELAEMLCERAGDLCPGHSAIWL